MSGALHIVSAGAMTTVQDLGRFGAQDLGISTCGALDPIALRLANALVGNAEDEAGLELRFIGPHIRVRGEPVRIALVGTTAEIHLLGDTPRVVPAGQSVTVPADEAFYIGPIRDTSCCYLAIAGGLDLQPHFGSLATFVIGGFGGYRGRALADGDELLLADRVLNKRGDQQLPRPFDYEDDATIRVVLGPQDDYFTTEALQTFLTTPYRISASANRMGLRLEGAPLTHAKGFNIPSDGIVTGAIQVPGTGLPIVLLADRQTTGGYPKIATVISADLPRLGRALPGDKIHFCAVSIAEAERIRRDQESAIQTLMQQIQPVDHTTDRLETRLLRENLVSGVVSGSWDEFGG